MYERKCLSPISALAVVQISDCLTRDAPEHLGTAPAAGVVLGAAEEGEDHLMRESVIFCFIKSTYVTRLRRKFPMGVQNL